MNEKVRTKYLSAGSISMSGNIQCDIDNVEVQVYYFSSHLCIIKLREAEISFSLG